MIQRNQIASFNLQSHPKLTELAIHATFNNNNNNSVVDKNMYYVYASSKAMKPLS